MPEPKERRMFLGPTQSPAQVAEAQKRKSTLDQVIEFLLRNPLTRGVQAAQAEQGFLPGVVSEVERGFRNLGDVAAGPYNTAADWWLGQGSPTGTPPASPSPQPSVAARSVSDPGAALGKAKPRTTFAGYGQPLNAQPAGGGDLFSRVARGEMPPVGRIGASGGRDMMYRYGRDDQGPGGVPLPMPPPDPFAPEPSAALSRSGQLMQMLFGGGQGGTMPPGAPSGLPGGVPGIGAPSVKAPVPQLPTGAGGFFYGLGENALPTGVDPGELPTSVRIGDALQKVLDITRPRYTFPDTDVTIGWRTPETMGMERQGVQDWLAMMKMLGQSNLQGAQADFYRARAASEADPMKMLYEMYPALARFMGEEEITKRALGVEGMRGETARAVAETQGLYGMGREQMGGEYGLQRARIRAEQEGDTAAMEILGQTLSGMNDQMIEPLDAARRLRGLLPGLLRAGRQQTASSIAGVIQALEGGMEE